MGLFGKKVKEITPAEMLDKIDKEVTSMAETIANGNDTSVQMIHMSGIKEGLEGMGHGRSLAVIGSLQGIIEMLYSAGLKEKHFARIILTVAESLSNSSEEMARMRREVAIEVNGPCDCPACVAEANGEVNLGGKSVKLNDLENMTPEQMDELVKGIMKDSPFGGSKQG